MLRRRFGPLALALILGAPLSCEAPAGDATADVPVSFLQERLREALDDIERARATLSEDLAGASARLDDSRLKLRRLDEYYLPLLAARQQVGAALRAVDSENGPAGAAVDSAEAVLLDIVRGHGRHLEGEMREPLERLADARTALAAGDAAEARRVLRKLRAQLESIFFRGDLVLHGSELDPDAGPPRD